MGLKALAEGGIESVRVERLAAALGVTKGSFYWHFRDRAALQAAVLDAWRTLATEDVIKSVEAVGGDARARIEALFTMVFSADGRLERAVRAWADSDAAVAAAVKAIDRQRMAYVESLFAELGLPRTEAKVRARFAYQALIGQYAMAGRDGDGDPPGGLRIIMAMLLRR
jgi:AcrR family transcriptional regulator